MNLYIVCRKRYLLKKHFLSTGKKLHEINKKPLPDSPERGVNTKKVPPQGTNPAGATLKN